MEKNMIVLDELGNEIGRTYPKRARGLVKNGRAEYIDDCTIRVWNAHAPTIIDNNVEDDTMSKIISFNTREFKSDRNYQGTGSASRMFITDMFNESQEIYELLNDSQIVCDKYLEPNENYAFRFVLVGDNNAGNEILQFMVIPFAGDDVTEDEWDNRYVFNLSQCQFKPVLNKRWGNASVRVYEVPFMTQGSGKIRFLFLEKNSSARILPARENEEYAQFAEYTMSGWINGKKEQFDKLKEKEFNINVDQTMRDIGEILKNTADKVKSAVPNFTVHTESGCTKNNNGMHANENLDGNELAVILNGISDGGNVNLNNSNIEDVENVILCGDTADGCNFTACNVNIGGKSFVGILQKIGDGCNIDFSNARIGSVSGDIAPLDSDSSGSRIRMTNAQFSEAAFGYLMSLIGDGCNVDFTNIVVNADDSDVAFGAPFDGVRIDFTNALIPDTTRNKLLEKIGEGCSVTGL